MSGGVLMNYEKRVICIWDAYTPPHLDLNPDGSFQTGSSHWPPWGPLYNENLKGFDEQLKSALEEARSKGEDVTQEEAERHLAALVGGFDGLKERFVKAFGADWRVEVILVNILDPHKWCDDAGQACSSSSSACRFAGCIHHLEQCLGLKQPQKQKLREAMRQLTITGGCGKLCYGACNKASCKACGQAQKLGGPAQANKYWECAHKIQAPCANCAPGCDSFTTTISVMNSAIKKLAKVTPLAAHGGVLYRGVATMAFPEQLLTFGTMDLSEVQPQPISSTSPRRQLRAGGAPSLAMLTQGAHDSKITNLTSNREAFMRGDTSFQDTCRGFVEFGFSSATPDKHVASEYSMSSHCKGRGVCPGFNKDALICTQHRSTILEIQTGQIDRGASVKWISQFPAENEHVLLPLSNFSVVGMRREVDGDKSRGEVNVLEIQLNANINAQSLDDMEKNRQQICLDFAKNLNLEQRQLLSGCPRDHVSGEPVISQKELHDQNTALIHKIQARDASLFNDTTTFKVPRPPAHRGRFRAQVQVVTQVQEQVQILGSLHLQNGGI